MQDSTAKENSPIGHNRPPTDAELLKDKLASDNAAAIKRADELIEEASNLPDKVETDEQAKAATDTIKSLMAARKSIETIRVNEKEPYLTLGRVVDGFFKESTNRLDQAKENAKAPLDSYIKIQAEKERQRRIEEAAKQRREAEEAAKIAAALEKTNQQEESSRMRDQATIAEMGAERLDRFSQASPADLSKTRTGSGALASLRTVWVGEVIDQKELDLGLLRHHLSPDALQKAVNSFVKAGGRELKGAKIYEKSETIVR
ncbi:hypothetical protein [uncultured Paraglaciecola sp.]|uniref:hypothetical protein n=1 Tax=uncultured Paraglaciecola sp. TaxID=1765024 RepID=UPI002617F75B|nr:hypothetical protein [uncultured Paraglaciecola sp.]